MSGAAARKQSGPALSRLAAEILQRRPKTAESTTADGGQPSFDDYLDDYNELLADAQALAGSVLSQDETKGQGA